MFAFVLGEKKDKGVCPRPCGNIGQRCLLVSLVGNKEDTSPVIRVDKIHIRGLCDQGIFGAAATGLIEHSGPVPRPDLPNHLPALTCTFIGISTLSAWQNEQPGLQMLKTVEYKNS